MAQKFNTEFNYRYQVIGNTPWERIKTLKGFLEGRVRALALEEVGKLKYQAKLAKLNHLKNGGKVLSATIDKYIYISCRNLPPFFKHKFRIVWSQIETVKKIDEIKHEAVKEMLKYFHLIHYYILLLHRRILSQELIEGFQKL